MSETPKIAHFCTRFKSGLKTLGIDGHDDIVDEIRTHLEAAEAEGRLDAALDEFGDPEVYARTFADEMRIEQAVMRDDPRHSLGTLFALSTRKTVAALGLLLTGLFYVFAASLLLLIPMELILPDMTGLWFEPDQHLFAFGVWDADGLEAPQERLGWFIIPVCAVLSLIFYLVGSRISRGALKLMRKQR